MLNSCIKTIFFDYFACSIGSNQKLFTVMINSKHKAFRRLRFLPILIFLLLGIQQITFSACNLPAGLTTTNITTNSAKFNWGATVSDSFLVRYNVTGTTNYLYKTVKPGTATSTTITGLYPATSYSWVVHTYCSGGASGGYQATPAQFTTPTGSLSCVIPNATSTTNIGPNSAVLNWNPLITADSFLIRYAPHNTTNYVWIQVPGSVHSYTLSNLPPNTSYDWRVRCMCASNPVQSYSVINVFTTLSSNCGSADPYYFTATNISYNSAVLGWNSVVNAVSYNVRYAIRYSNNWITVNSTGPQKSITALQPNQTYEFQVQVVCASGAGYWSTSGVFTTPSAVLSLTRGPYLQMSTTSSIYIRWRTSLSSNSRVRFGISPTNLNFIRDDATSTTEHIVQLTGLAANTKYYYSVGSTTATLQGDTGNYFITNPPVGSSGAVRIWTIGDFGVSSTGQYQVRDAYANYPSSANTNVWLWVGDNAYTDGTDLEYTNNVFSKYPYQMKKWVIWPATGNHDLHSANASNQTGPYFDNFTLPKGGEVGGVPSGTEAYYSFNYANIHFICLESTDAVFRATGGAMATWLVNDLNANTQRWTIVYFHHPPYSKGSHNSDTDIEMIQMRTNIIPILESKKVDLVLTGHSHSYERSMMLKGHYGAETTFNAATMAVNSGSGTFPQSYSKMSPSYNGTVYVVCGVSGQRGATTSGWPHNAMFSSSVDYFGSLVIDVVGDRLDCKFLTNTGSIYDEFTIQKVGAPLKQIVEAINPAFPAGDPLQVFPNPMSYESTIRYVLDNASNVRVEITDMTGRLIYTLLDGSQDKGEYELKLTKSEAVLPGGVYFIRLIAGEHTHVKKILIND
jgi:hypothetical protein